MGRLLFLYLAGETRNQIYSYLYWWEPDTREGGEVCPSPHLIHSDGRGEFNDLVAPSPMS